MAPHRSMALRGAWPAWFPALSAFPAAPRRRNAREIRNPRSYGKLETRAAPPPLLLSLISAAVCRCLPPSVFATRRRQVASRCVSALGSVLVFLTIASEAGRGEVMKELSSVCWRGWCPPQARFTSAPAVSRQVFSITMRPRLASRLAIGFVAHPTSGHSGCAPGHASTWRLPLRRIQGGALPSRIPPSTGLFDWTETRSCCLPSTGLIACRCHSY